MKFLILVCLLGYTAASFLQEAAPAVDNSVIAFLEGTMEAGSLGETLGCDDPIFADVEDDIKTDLGKSVKEAFDKILEHIKEHIDHGKEVSEEMLKKVKDLREKLKDLKIDASDKAKELLEKIKKKAKEVIKNLLEKLGLGKRNLDHEMDAVARMKLGGVVEKIREKILCDETIQKIREYIKRLVSDNPIVQELKEIIEKLRDVDIIEILNRLLEYRVGRSSRAIGDSWEKIKEFFKDLNVKIQEHSKKFAQWVMDMWGKGIDKLKEKYGTVRAIAMEFIVQAKDTSVEVAKEALEFFRPYKEDLGSLWDQLVDAAKEAIGRF